MEIRLYPGLLPDFVAKRLRWHCLQGLRPRPAEDVSSYLIRRGRSTKCNAAGSADSRRFMSTLLQSIPSPADKLRGTSPRRADRTGFPEIAPRFGSDSAAWIERNRSNSRSYFEDFTIDRQSNMARRSDARMEIRLYPPALEPIQEERRPSRETIPQYLQSFHLRPTNHPARNGGIQ